MATRSKEEAVKLVLRLPRDLHKTLTEEAHNAIPKNSLNREIVARLYASLEADAEIAEWKDLPEDQAMARLLEMVKRVRSLRRSKKKP
jgi:hypothetical protein